MRSFENRRQLIADYMINHKIIMCQYRGWMIGGPYTLMGFYAAFQIYHEKQAIAVIVGASYPVMMGTPHFEPSCCYNRFETFDELLDHFKEFQCLDDQNNVVK